VSSRALQWAVWTAAGASSLALLAAIFTIPALYAEVGSNKEIYIWIKKLPYQKIIEKINDFLVGRLSIKIYLNNKKTNLIGPKNIEKK
jgi:hypothetical protein